MTTICHRGHVMKLASERCLPCQRIWARRFRESRYKKLLIEPETETLPRSAMPASAQVVPSFWKRLMASVKLMTPDETKVVRLDPEIPYHLDPRVLHTAAAAHGIKIGYRLFGYTLYIWRV